MLGNMMRQHGGLVTIGGLLLALAGFYAMWSGWDHIQLERGWAQYIAGAVGVSGGAVTMALGRVISAIGRQASGGHHEAAVDLTWPPRKTHESRASAESIPASDSRPSQKSAPKPALVSTSAGASSDVDHFRAELSAAEAPTPSRPPAALSAQTWPPATPEPVDRYVAGDAEYVMYSDGSIEVRSGDQAERYESLAALRAEAARRM